LKPFEVGLGDLMYTCTAKQNTMQWKVRPTVLCSCHYIQILENRSLEGLGFPTTQSNCSFTTKKDSNNSSQLQGICVLQCLVIIFNLYMHKKPLVLVSSSKGILIVDHVGAKTHAIKYCIQNIINMRFCTKSYLSMLRLHLIYETNHLTQKYAESTFINKTIKTPKATKQRQKGSSHQML
jgi:hypothetical protein